MVTQLNANVCWLHPQYTKLYKIIPPSLDKKSEVSSKTNLPEIWH